MAKEVVEGTVITLTLVDGRLMTHIDEGYPGYPSTLCFYAGRNAQAVFYTLKRGDYIKAEARFIKDHLQLTHICLPNLSKAEFEKRMLEAREKMPVRVVYINSNPGSYFIPDTLSVPWGKGKIGFDVGMKKGTIKRLGL